MARNAGPTGPGDIRVAYLLSVAPQPRSAYTADEIAALEGLVQIFRTGVTTSQRRADTRWITSGRAKSLSSIGAVATQFLLHPIPLARSLLTLLIHSRSWRDLLVALRSAAGACVLAELVNPEIIHAQFAGPAAAAAYVWSEISGNPWTVRVHAYDVYTPYSWAAEILRSSACVLTISRDAQRVLAEMGVESRVLHVGIPATTIPQRTSGPPARPFRFLSVGALVQKKGHAETISTIHALARSGVPVQLDIFGAGPLWGELKTAAESGPADIRLHGHVSNKIVRSSYRKYDAFILGARMAANGDRDGIPVVLMEAMAAHLPVMSTITGGIGELLVDGHTGVALPRDLSSRVETIAAALENYDELEALASAAAEIVSHQFDVHRTAIDLAELWADLVDHPIPTDEPD